MANIIFRKNGTNYTIDGLIAGTGHLIKNSSGQEVADRQYLQFNGAYLGDDSVGDATEVNVVRTMTQSQFNNLSAAEKEGLIYISDAAGQLTASEVALAAIAGMSATTVQSGISELNSDKVEKSGDTMTGNLTVDRKNGTASAEGYSYFTLGNDTPAGTNQNSTGLIRLYSETAYPAIVYANALTQIRYIGFPNRSGTLSMRTVTTLVNESVSIAAGASKQYATLTSTALLAYDEVVVMIGYSNQMVNAVITKAEMTKLVNYSSGGITGATMCQFGRLLISGGSIAVDYSFGVRPLAAGMYLYNRSTTTSIDSVLIEGITY